MTAKATRELLARHVNHRTLVKDERTLRCLDCSHTLLLDHGRSALTNDDRPTHVTDDQAEPRIDQDRFGRLPCARCGKRVSHFYTDDQAEPVPHTTAAGLACTAPPKQTAPPRSESIAAIRQQLAGLPTRSRRTTP